MGPLFEGGEMGDLLKGNPPLGGGIAIGTVDVFAFQTTENRSRVAAWKLAGCVLPAVSLLLEREDLLFIYKVNCI